MLSNKSIGIAGVAMLGTIAMLGTTTAHAKFDLDAVKETTVYYGQETLTVRRKVGGTQYYTVDTDMKKEDPILEDSGHLLYVVGKLGINAGTDVVTVRYDLTNMIFTAPVSYAGDDVPDFRNEKEGRAIANAVVRQGGSVGDSSVTLTFPSTPDFGANGTDRAVLALRTVGVALNEFGGIKMSVIVGNVTHESSYTKGIMVAKGFVAKVDDFADRPRNAPISEVRESFSRFTQPAGAPVAKKVATVGSFHLRVKEETDNGAPIRDASDSTQLDDVGDMILTSDDSTVTIKGDFGFAHKVTLDTEFNCENAAGADDLLLRDADDALKSTSMLTALAAGAFDGSNPMHICIMIDEDAADLEIPNTDNYTLTTEYAGIDGAHFAPMGGTHSLSRIMKNGTTVIIPYLTKAAQYNQRIVLRNFGPNPADYDMTFHPEDGVTAMAGEGASGTLAAGETKTISALRGDVVTLTGGNRTAAVLRGGRMAWTHVRGDCYRQS